LYSFGRGLAWRGLTRESIFVGLVFILKHSDWRQLNEVHDSGGRVETTINKAILLWKVTRYGRIRATSTLVNSISFLAQQILRQLQQQNLKCRQRGGFDMNMVVRS
jgi:hypothetical protein